MDKNQTYVQNVKLEEIPWHRITTAYSVASDFPEYFNKIWAMNSLALVKEALDEIMSNIEHQGTLWHSTPFAMIFLVRILEHAASETEKMEEGHSMEEGQSKEIADFIVANLLDFFQLIAECYFDFTEEFGEEEPLPCFSDMLNEEYLASETCEEDEEYDMSIYDNENLFYSCWYYSYQTLLYCKPILEKLKNTPFQEKADELLEML